MGFIWGNMGESILVEGGGTGAIKIDWSFAALYDKIPVNFAQSLRADRLNSLCCMTPLVVADYTNKQL